MSNLPFDPAEKIKLLEEKNQHSIDVNTPQPEMPPSSEGILEYTWKRRSDWMFCHGFPLLAATMVASGVFKFNRVKSAFTGFFSDQTLDYLKKFFKQSKNHGKY